MIQIAGSINLLESGNVNLNTDIMKGKCMQCGGTKMKAGGSKFPDLTGDGKVTRADILKGRGVIKKTGGSVKKKK